MLNENRRNKELFVRFESIVCLYDGVECWSGRELHSILGYTQWRNFIPAIEKAKSACESAGESIEDHFANVRKMIELAKGAQREVDGRAN